MKSKKNCSYKKNKTQKRKKIRKYKKHTKTYKKGGKRTRDIHYRTVKRRKMRGGIQGNIVLDGKNITQEFNTKLTSTMLLVNNSINFTNKKAEKVIKFLTYAADIFDKVKSDPKIKKKPFELVSITDRKKLNKIILAIEKKKKLTGMQKLTAKNESDYNLIKSKIKNIIGAKRMPLVTATGKPAGSTMVIAKPSTTTSSTTATTTNKAGLPKVTTGTNAKKPATTATTTGTTTGTTGTTTGTTATTTGTTATTTATTAKKPVITTGTTAKKPATTTGTTSTNTTITTAKTVPKTTTGTKPVENTTLKPAIKYNNSKLKSFADKRKTTIAERGKELKDVAKLKKKNVADQDKKEGKLINDDTFTSFKKKKIPILNLINEFNDYDLSKNKIIKNDYKKTTENKINKYFTNADQKKTAYDKIISYLNTIPTVKPKNMKTLSRDDKNEILYIIEQAKIFKTAIGRTKPSDDEFDKFISMIISPSIKKESDHKKQDEKDRVINIQITLPEATYVGQYDKGQNNAEVSVGKLVNAINT